MVRINLPKEAISHAILILKPAITHIMIDTSHIVLELVLVHKSVVVIVIAVELLPQIRSQLVIRHHIL